MSIFSVLIKGDAELIKGDAVLIRGVTVFIKGDWTLPGIEVLAA